MSFIKEKRKSLYSSLHLERITGLGRGARRALFEPNTNRQRKKEELALFLTFGADYGARTRHLNLGKVALYQMS